MTSPQALRQSVQDYYGKVLRSQKDLKTSACCTSESLPDHIKALVGLLHEEVVRRFYGCGSPLPLALEGCTVLDLGCGSGRDSYLLSKLVGRSGRVIGVDMTSDQLEVAKRHRDFHSKQFRYSESNVTFLQGYIEDLKSLGIEDNSVDVVVSNCVINLSPDKEAVFREIFRVLKPGGELHFSDVFAGRRIPEALRTDPVIRGECLGGALYIQDFRRLLASLDILDYRTVSQRRLRIEEAALAERLGPIPFYSVTVRAFKLALEDRCEDYGQLALYKGGLPEAPDTFQLDDHHVFEKDRPLAVCGNTAKMLSETRFGPYFEIIGTGRTHFGLFECTPTEGQGGTSPDTLPGCC